MRPNRMVASCALVLSWLLLTACGGGASKEVASDPVPDTPPTAEQAPAPARLNVVFMLSDALRAPNLPMYGYKRQTAPHMSELTKEALFFDWHYSNASYTRMSVSQMFTGMLHPPVLMGSQHAGPVRHDLPDDLLVLPRFMREQGYYTAMVSSHPWFNETARALAAFDWHEVHKKHAGAYMKFGRMMKAVREGFDKVQQDGKPFFFYIHSMDTHTPNRMHRTFTDHKGDGLSSSRYDKYDSEIRYTDAHVHLVMQEIEERGLADNTLVVFTSDHGEEFQELGRTWFNRTHGANVRRAANHIPLWIRMPKRYGARGRFKDVTSHLDVAPTVAGLALDGTDLSRYRFDGQDLSRRVRDKQWQASDRSVFSVTSRYMAMRQGQHPGQDFIYDRWSDSVTVYGHEPNQHNYPVPSALPSGQADAALVGKLEDIARKPSDHFRTLTARPPEPRDALLRSIEVVTEQTDRPPGFATQEGRWKTRPGRFVQCAPGADCGRLTLRNSIAPGPYQISLVLERAGDAKDYRQGIQVRLGAEAEPVVFRPRKAGPEELDLGRHTLSGTLELTLEKPAAGFWMKGIRVKYLGAEQKKQEGAVSEELTKKLRALGYVE